MASGRRHQKLHPYQTDPLPAGSKIDSLLAKAEPISEAGGIPGKMYLRRGKSAVQQL